MIEKEIQTLTAAIIELTNTLKSQPAPVKAEPAPEKAPEPTPEKAEPEPKKAEKEPTPPKEEPTPEPEKEYTLEQLKNWVKVIFAEKGGDAVSAVISGKFGAKRLTEVDPSKYSEVAKEFDKILPEANLNG